MISITESWSELLTYFMQLVSFYNPWKHQKTRGFLMFTGGVERDKWKQQIAIRKKKLGEM